MPQFGRKWTRTVDTWEGVMRGYRIRFCCCRCCWRQAWLRAPPTACSPASSTRRRRRLRQAGLAYTAPDNGPAQGSNAYPAPAGPARPAGSSPIREVGLAGAGGGGGGGGNGALMGGLLGAGAGGTIGAVTSQTLGGGIVGAVIGLVGGAIAGTIASGNYGSNAAWRPRHRGHGAARRRPAGHGGAARRRRHPAGRPGPDRAEPPGRRAGCAGQHARPGLIRRLIGPLIGLSEKRIRDVRQVAARLSVAAGFGGRLGACDRAARSSRASSTRRLPSGYRGETGRVVSIREVAGAPRQQRASATAP